MLRYVAICFAGKSYLQPTYKITIANDYYYPINFRLFTFTKLVIDQRMNGFKTGLLIRAIGL